MNAELMKYAKEHSWEKQMDGANGFDSWTNYSGPNLGNLVVVLSRSRDSEILDESNFESALDMLGGESKNVKVERFGHWACGWFELILVDPKSKKHLKIAQKIHNELKDYPVLDESDYSEREWEYQSNYANGAKNELAKALSLHFNVKVSPMLIKISYELNIACQSYYGNDSCINVYSRKEPDLRDIESLKKCMDQIAYTFENSKVFNKLNKSINEYKFEK